MLAKRVFWLTHSSPANNQREPTVMLSGKWLGFETANRLRHDRGDQLTRNVRQSEIPSLISECQLRVFDSQEMQNSRMEIVNVYRILDDVVAIVIGSTISKSLLDSCARKPD